MNPFTGCAIPTPCAELSDPRRVHPVGCGCSGGDVAHGEDGCWVRTGHAAEHVAVARHIALNLPY